MGLFDKIFGKKAEISAESFFKTLTAYRPVFTTWGGSIYESELVRAAIDARARHASKLGIVISGSAQPSLCAALRKQPNEWQTWGQFLYRLSTILDINNTACIVPVLDRYGNTSGLFPVLPTSCEIVSYRDIPYLRYKFASGEVGSMELSRCAILTKHQYQSDFFGESNQSLNTTMQLIDIQNQGIKEGVKNSATFRFMAQANNFAFGTDLAKERKRFNADNFKDGDDGILLFPNTYSNIKQIDSRPFVIDPKQMELIQTNVFNYFGVNADVLQNKAYGDAWSAFYEGAVEPFAIQLSDTVTKAIFTDRERANGAQLMATSNRLQYMTTSEKLNVSASLSDRGILNRDEVREIWNLPPLPNGEGQAYIIRGEYYNADEKLNEEGEKDAD